MCFQLAKKHRNGQLPKVDWSDRLAFREIELINENEKKNSKLLHLMVEFPPIVVNDLPVSFSSNNYGKFLLNYF